MSDSQQPVEKACGTLALVERRGLQFAVSLLTGVVVLAVFFRGNRFLTAPCQSDDYSNLIGYQHYGMGLAKSLLTVRPVSTHLIWCLSALGPMAFYLVMLLLVALLPVLAVSLAVRLFRFRPDPWLMLWLTAAVSCCTFLTEQSLWFYRFTGMMTNLTSAVMGMLAAEAFCRYFDGRKGALFAGIGLFVLAAFAKEDFVVFVPLYVTVDWLLRRRSLQAETERVASVRQLVLALGSIAAIGLASVFWNNWVMRSPFTSNADPNYALNLAPSYLIYQAWHYATATRTPQVASTLLAAAFILAVLRRGQRLAALGMIPLFLAMVLPYTVLPRFIEYYVINWLSMVVAMGLVAIGVTVRPPAVVCGAKESDSDSVEAKNKGSRLLGQTIRSAGLTKTDKSPLAMLWATLAWGVPITVVLTAILVSPLAQAQRQSLANWTTVSQQNNGYILEQLKRRAGEFAGAQTIIVRGVDEVLSPWGRVDAAYLTSQLGRPVAWLVVARPGSWMAKVRTRDPEATTPSSMVFEEDLARFPTATTVLQFDANLNLTVLDKNKPVVGAAK